MQTTAVINTIQVSCALSNFDQGYRFDKNDEVGLQLSYYEKEPARIVNNASCVQGGQDVAVSQPHLATEMFSAQINSGGPTSSKAAQPQ